MCGIVGFTGEHQAAPILLDGLAKLEYRGYDSAGIAVRDGDADVEVIKAKGRLKVLAEKTNDGETVKGTCGIGHTRWATHGEPSENNAHPHKSVPFTESFYALTSQLPPIDGAVPTACATTFSVMLFISVPIANIV